MKELPINFLLKNIRTEQFAVMEENFTENGRVTLNTNIYFKVNNKDKLVGSFLTFTFSQSKNVFLKIQVSCHFQIENKSWMSFHNSQNSLITIPNHFLTHLAIIAVGTARGVLFEKNEGTRFDKFIIPTINVTELIKKDGVFPIN